MIFGLDKVIAKVVLKKYAKKYMEGKNMPTQGKVRFWGTIAASIVAVVTGILPAVGVDPNAVNAPAWTANAAYILAILFQLLKKDK